MCSYTPAPTAIGAGAQATESNTVSFGSSLQTSRLVNVSNGVANTDVATVGQLNSALAGVSGGATVSSVTAAQTTANAAQSTASTAIAKADSAITTANNAQATATNALDRVNTIAQGVADSMAMSAATSNAALAAARSEKGLGVGFGSSVFAGNTSMSLSLAKNWQKVTFTASSSIGSVDTAAQLGVGWSF